jgi:hypothetical protein
MAPVNESTHTMSAPAVPSTHARGTSEYTTITVGHGSSAATIQTLIAPSIHALLPDKAMAFDFLFNQLKPLHPTQNAKDLTTALSNHFDINYSIAMSETAAVIATLNSALYQCTNLRGIRFLDRDGAPISNISEDPSMRDDGIAYFVFDSTILPTKTDCRLSPIGPFTIRFALPLPQHERQSAMNPTANPFNPTTPNANTNDSSPTTLERTIAAALEASETAAGDEYINPAARLAALQQQVRTIMEQTPRRLFDSTATTGGFPSFSPKMAQILANNGDPGSQPTYLGSLHFLDDQPTFDAVFPLPVPCEDDGCPSDRTVTASVAHRIATFMGECELTLFAHILRIDYVGSEETSNPEMIRQISDRLSRLKVVYQSRGVTHTCRPDDLYKKYLSEVPVLPDDTSLWGFTLTNYYWCSLSDEMQCRITDNKMYTLPDMSTLVTKTSQLHELRKLRTAAVQAAKEIADQDAKLTRMIAERMGKSIQQQQHPATSRNTATIATMTSAAESTMKQYMPQPPSNFPEPPILPNPWDPTRPTSTLVTDPATGYVSPHSREFTGCLGCGSTTHQYRDCPLHKTEPTHSTFTKNFLARYPERRKFPPRPEEITTLVTTLPPAFAPASAPTNRPSSLRHKPAGGMGRGISTTLPAWMTQTPTITELSPDTEPNKKTRLITISVKVLQQNTATSPPIRPFPIRMNNKMPAIDFNLGTKSDSSVSLVCLYDTCAAVSSGNLGFHQWVITTYPELVHSYEQFDDSNPFEPIKLIGAIKDPADYNEDDHGKLTAVVRYHLPYSDPDSNSVALCIALGNDVSVNTILGWAAIEDLGIELRISGKTFYSTTLNCYFPLERVEATCGTPANVEFNPATDFKRPPPPSPTTPNVVNTQPATKVQFKLDRKSPTEPATIAAQPAAAQPAPTVHFDPSTQMKELSAAMNAATRTADLLCPNPSDTSTMHALASGHAAVPIPTPNLTS